MNATRLSNADALASSLRQGKVAAGRFAQRRTRRPASGCDLRMASHAVWQCCAMQES